MSQLQPEDSFTTRSVLSVRVTGDEDFTEYFCVGTELQDAAIRPTYEALLAPDSNTRSSDQIFLLRTFSRLNFSRTPEGFRAYQLD